MTKIYNKELDELFTWVHNQKLQAVQLNPQCNAYAIEAYRLTEEKILEINDRDP